MLLSRAVSDVFIYCCEYGTHKKNMIIDKKLEKLEKLVKTEVVAFLKHVKACLMT